LASVLLPHLDREVEVAMPMVSASITHADWQAIEQRYNIKPKSLRQLGIEGQWLLDGIDPEGRRVVLHTVSLVPRLILLYGFARLYRRQARDRWQPDANSDAEPPASQAREHTS
jgi:hypothetical protein